MDHSVPPITRVVSTSRAGTNAVLFPMQFVAREEISVVAKHNIAIFRVATLCVCEPATNGTINGTIRVSSTTQ